MATIPQGDTMAVPINLCNEVIRGLQFSRQCAFARAVGYDGLEIAPFTLSSAPHELSSSQIHELRTIAESEGVAIAGLHWLLAAPENLSITSADEAVWLRTVHVGRRMVELCAKLGGRYLIHGSPGQRRLETGREAEGRARGAAYFAAMAEAAAEAGVAYLIEPLSMEDTSFINTIEEALAIVRAVSSPALGTMIDCYATAANGGDVTALLKRWLPEGVVGHIHFNDSNRRGPGEGAIDFAAVVDALRDLDYRGAIGVEPFVYQPDGTACAARAIGYVRGLMEARAAR